MSEQVFQTRYETYRTAVESYLETLFAGRPDWRDLYESMRYSLLAGGKRIRPVLTLEFARLAGLADWKTALPMACALELVHTYSLIHDDLPCMDNDDLRRGKPTNHKVYGETLAVLAGDALQPEAYRLILTAPGLDESRRAACGRILAEVSGADGMVAGQVLDTLHAPKTEAEVTEVHRLKTGAMIAGACRLGVAAAGGSGRRRNVRPGAGAGLPDPGRHAGRVRRRGGVRQAHRFRQRGGEGHLHGPAGAGGLRPGGPRPYGGGQGRGGGLGHGRLPGRPGGLPGGAEQVKSGAAGRRPLFCPAPGTVRIGRTARPVTKNLRTHIRNMLYIY